LAPQDEHISEHAFGEFGVASILHAVNRKRKTLKTKRPGLCTCGRHKSGDADYTDKCRIGFEPGPITPSLISGSLPPGTGYPVAWLLRSESRPSCR
jgi:hypothetical protein